MQGWQLLIHTSQESFEAVVTGQQKQGSGNTTQTQSQPNELARTNPLGSLAAAAQGLSVQLHATEIMAELVGNIFRGGFCSWSPAQVD